MPVDPNISLQVQVPGAGGSLAPGGVLGMANSAAELMTRLNQNALFQQTWAANHQMGQIMAGAPDIDSGIAQILRSPAAPFSGPFLSNLRAMDKTMLDMSIAKSGAAQGAIGGYLKSLSGAYADPSMIPALRAATLATTPKEAMPQVAGAIDSLNLALLDGIEPMVKSGDPQQLAQAQQLFRNRTLGMLGGSGVGADTLRALSGKMAPGLQTIQGPQGQPMPGIVGGGLLNPGANQFQPLTPSSGNQPAPGPNALVPGGASSLIGPTRQQAEEMTKAGAAAGSITEELSQTAKNLPQDLNRINLMETALGKFQAGGLAEFREIAARTLQGFKNAGINIPEDTIQKVGNESLASTQVFQSEVRPQVIRELQQAATGTGRVMRSEVDAFLAMMNVNSDPETLRQKINQAKYNAAVEYDKIQRFQDFRAKGGDPLNFQAQYLREFDPYAVPARAPGGLDFSPVDPKIIKGAPANADPWLGWGEQAPGISRGAVEKLRANRGNPEAAKEFERRFRLPAGGAQRYLGAQ